MNKQIELLIESAEMWLHSSYNKSNEDPLCIEYYDFKTACTDCPICEVTNKWHCENTPYDDVEMAATTENCQAFGEWLNCLAEELIEKDRNNG